MGDLAGDGFYPDGMADRLDRFYRLAAREERRPGWVAAWALLALILLAAAGFCWSWATSDGLSADRDALAALVTLVLLFAIYLVFAPLVHWWPHHQSAPVWQTMRTPPPDFTEEWEWERDLYATYVRDEAHDKAIDAWIEHVYRKLLKWSPAAAREFTPPVVKATPESIAKVKSSPGYTMAKVAESVNPQPKSEPALQRLKVHADRLAAILSPSPLDGGA